MQFKTYKREVQGNLSVYHLLTSSHTYFCRKWKEGKLYFKDDLIRVQRTLGINQVRIKMKVRNVDDAVSDSNPGA